MKVFSSFKELMDYVPNCIICGKLLQIHLKGSIRVIKTNVGNENWTLEKIHFHLKMKDELLVGNYKKHSIAINPIDNKIVLGLGIIQHLLISWTWVSKKCSTCRCEVTSKFIGNNKDFDKFPPLTLTNEELSFTRKREKAISIAQNYYADPPPSGVRTFILINNKPIKPLYIDFNQFKNLDHLNKRLSTMLVFS